MCIYIYDIGVCSYGSSRALFESVWGIIQDFKFLLRKGFGSIWCIYIYMIIYDDDVFGHSQEDSTRI
jgi:hypothetical protein